MSLSDAAMDAAYVDSQPPAILLPCAESCAYFHQIHADRWSDFGLCGNPRSPRRGYPVRLGRDCRYFKTKPAPS